MITDDLFSKQHLTRCDEVCWCFQMVKGLGLTGVTTEELLHIAVAVYLLKQKGEVFQNLILLFICSRHKIQTSGRSSKHGISILKFLEPQGDTSETMEDEEEEEDTGLENSPPSEVNVEEQACSNVESGNNPNKETEEDETMMNVSSTSSYKPSKPSDDSSTSVVNVVSHASRPKKHLGSDAVKVKLQHDKQREAQTKLLSEMHDTMKDSKK